MCFCVRIFVGFLCACVRPSVYARVSVGEWEAYACIITDWLDDEMTMIYVGALEKRGEETIFMTLRMRDAMV